MKNFKIGLQLYSVRDELQKDFENTLKKVSDMGYEYVEFAGYYANKSGEEIKALLNKYSLKCISVHQGIDMFLEKGQEAINFFKTFGVKYWVLPWYSQDALAGTDKWEETKTSFTSLGKALRENGMQLLYHNHDFEFNTFEGKYLIDHLFDDIPDDLILPEFDTCWIKYAGEDPCKYIEKFAGKIEVLHLKDFVCSSLNAGPVYALIGGSSAPTKEENNFKFCPCGSGLQDFESIIKSADKADVEYLIVEQDNWYDNNALDEVKKSREYLKTLGI